MPEQHYEQFKPIVRDILRQRGGKADFDNLVALVSAKAGGNQFSVADTIVRMVQAHELAREGKIVSAPPA